METNSKDFDTRASWIPRQNQLYEGSYVNPQTGRQQLSRPQNAGQPTRVMGQKPRAAEKMPKARALALANTLKRWLAIASIVGFGTFGGLVALHQVSSSTTTSQSTSTNSSSNSSSQNSNGFFKQQGGNTSGTSSSSTRALRQVALRQHLSAEPTPPEYSTPAGLRREEFRAMGTTISLLLPESQAESGAQIVRTLFSEWERALSRFLPESELSQLNAQAGTPIAVSDLLYTVLATALTAAQATEGVYDPALLDQLVRVGYDRTFDELPAVSFDPIIPGEPGGRWRGIKVDPIHRHVTLPTGIKLDFGGIAKGMAVDAALERLGQGRVSPALVNAGGDLAVLGLPAGAEQWPVSVPGLEQFWTIPLHHGAIATSGIARRHWWQGKTLRHHLLDPRTGLPAQSDLWSVTVVADRCEQAEVAAKVAFILGSRQGADFLRKHHIAGLLVREDGRWDAVEPWPIDFMEEVQQ